MTLAAREDGPRDKPRDKKYLESAKRNIDQAKRAVHRSGVMMDKAYIRTNIDEAKANLMHVTNCDMKVREAKKHLNDALHEMNERMDERKRRNKMSDHLDKAKDKTVKCERKDR